MRRAALFLGDVAQLACLAAFVAGLMTLAQLAA